METDIRQRWTARRIAALRAALEEIRDVARVSEGVEFYAMLAEKALTNDEEENQ